jgi:HK97 family phage major capsid protein
MEMSVDLRSTPGQRSQMALLAKHGFDPKLIGAVYARAADPTTTSRAHALAESFPIPASSEELAELVGDPGRFGPAMASTSALTAFIDRYAASRQAPTGDLQRMVENEAQRTLRAMLTEAGETSAARLNLAAAVSPRTGNAQIDAQRRYSVGYRPDAVGAQLDGQFRDTADFARAIWHLNARPEDGPRRELARNAMSTTVPGDGGFLVPETFRAELLRIGIEQSVMRSGARVLPMDSPRVHIPAIDVTSNASHVYGGMAGYWTEEGAALTDSQATFRRVMLEAFKLTGYTVVNNELLADSIISLAALIDQLWPEAIAFFEDRAFLRGTGAGEPLGMVNCAASVAVSKEAGQAADTIVWQNVVKMYARMLPASLNRAVWLASPNVFPELATMALSVGTGGGPVWLSNGVGSPPVTILGRPVIFTEKLPVLGDRGDLVFADRGYYLIGDRQAMSMDASPHYRFGNDQTAFRIIQRVTGRPWLTSALTPANSGDTLTPFVELAERA